MSMGRTMQTVIAVVIVAIIAPIAITAFADADTRPVKQEQISDTVTAAEQTAQTLDKITNLPVYENSEKVVYDGATLVRDTDYEIDYATGVIDFNGVAFSITEPDPYTIDYSQEVDLPTSLQTIFTVLPILALVGIILFFIPGSPLRKRR